MRENNRLFVIQIHFLKLGDKQLDKFERQSLCGKEMHNIEFYILYF